MSRLGSRGRAGQEFVVCRETGVCQARVCFELNAAVVVVAVLVLRHTSSVHKTKGSLGSVAATTANRGIETLATSTAASFIRLQAAH